MGRAKAVATVTLAVVVFYFSVGALLHYVVFPEHEPPDWAYGRSGTVVETPTGERIEVLRGAVETGGEFSEGLVTVAPGGHPSRAHIHPHQEERFQVQSGTVTFIVDSEEHVAHEGEVIVVPPGTAHQFYNRSDVAVSFVGRITPAGKLGLFFGQMKGLHFKPGFLQMMLFVQAYDAYPASPPPAVVRTMSFLVAPTARLFGYRSFYPEFAERALGPAAQ